MVDYGGNYGPFDVNVDVPGFPGTGDIGANPYSPSPVPSPTTPETPIDPLEQFPGVENPEGYPGWLWPVPPRPEYPGLSGVAPYDIPSAPMPDQEWYQNTQPLREAQQWQLQQTLGNTMEGLGGLGMLGSASGGLGGAGGAGMMERFMQMQPQQEMNLWNMTQPGLMGEWEAGIDRGKLGYGMGIQEQLGQWGVDTGQYQDVQNQYQIPYGMLPGMLGNTYSTPVVDQGQQSMLPSLMMMAPFMMK